MICYILYKYLTLACNLHVCATSISHNWTDFPTKKVLKVGYFDLDQQVNMQRCTKNHSEHIWNDSG